MSSTASGDFRLPGVMPGPHERHRLPGFAADDYAAVDDHDGIALTESGWDDFAALSPKAIFLCSRTSDERPGQRKWGVVNGKSTTARGHGLRHRGHARHSCGGF